MYTTAGVGVAKEREKAGEGLGLQSVSKEEDQSHSSTPNKRIKVQSSTKMSDVAMPHLRKASANIRLPVFHSFGLGSNSMPWTPDLEGVNP